MSLPTGVLRGHPGGGSILTTVLVCFCFVFSLVRRISLAQTSFGSPRKGAGRSQTLTTDWVTRGEKVNLGLAVESPSVPMCGFSSFI